MNTPVTDRLRLGTRGSLLARMQSRLVADALETAHRGLRVELVITKTTGDVILDRPLHELGGKGLFVKELEQALLAGAVDFAVHSFKDVPVTMPLVDPSNLVIAATPAREDPRDVLARPAGRPPAPGGGGVFRLADLPAGGVVGTGSLRRMAQVLFHRGDLAVRPIRGNIDTRLKKLDAGEYDAVLLALAGVRRAGLFDASRMTPVEADEILPAPGQGALALQCRRDDQRTGALLAALHHPATALCVDAERAVVARLNGDCHSPIAALATLEGESGEALRLQAAVGARDGRPPVVRAQAAVPAGAWRQAVDAVCNSLFDQDARTLLGMGEASGFKPVC